MTLNYPDEDHWTWQRFLPGAGTSGTHPDHPDRMWFRIPPGERASAEDRAEWQRALAERPDLLRRLLEGQPGSIMLGQQVAQGFNQDIHVSRDRLSPIANEPLYMGQDFGLTPATVIGQPGRYGEIHVLASLPCERGGIRQHLENSVIPWLRTRTPWVFRSSGLLHGTYDPSAPDSQNDSDQNPVKQLEQMLAGSWWYPGPVDWESRKGPLLTSMQRRLLLDPVDARPLGRWYYTQDRLGAVIRDIPKKNHPWSDLGDAFCYFLCGVMPEMGPRLTPKKVTVVTQHGPCR